MPSLITPLLRESISSIMHLELRDVYNTIEGYIISTSDMDPFLLSEL